MVKSDTKTGTRFGICNVRDLYRLGSLKTVTTEQAKCQLDTERAQEVRWGKLWLKNQQRNVHLRMEI